MEKINIAELLKDCPKGMELDCASYDNVSFDKISDDKKAAYPIFCYITDKEGNRSGISFTENGCESKRYGAKCVIFPKGKTTWEGFTPPVDFKDGDIVSTDSGAWVGITVGGKPKEFIPTYCVIKSCGEFKAYLGKKGMWAFNRLATEDEKEKLFNTIKENGYRWDNETKTLVKLVEPKFKIEKGKWYVCIKDLLDNYANKAFCKGDIYYSPEDEYLIPSNSNVPSKVEYCINEYFRDWTIQDAKDGDVIFYDDGWTCIFKCIHGIWYSSYCFITDDGEFHTSYERHAVDATINGNAHIATKEQCNFLFQKIKEAGYKWNPETKTLEKLPKFKIGDRIKWIKTDNIYEIIKILSNCYIAKYLGSDITILFDRQDEYELVPNKFDINVLVPFESKVLVSDYGRWMPAVYGGYNKSYAKPFFVIGGNCYSKCIPYEGNEYLSGTTKDCSDFYKIWEK